MSNEFETKTLQDYLRSALKRFDEKSDLQKKRIIQSVIPMIVVHEDHRVELKINPDPSGPRTGFPPCHGAEETVRVVDKWRDDRLKSQFFASIPQLSDFIQLIEHPLYRDKSFVHQKYVLEGLSITQIASQIFVSKEAVRKALIDFNIPLRKPHRHHGHPSQPRYGEKVRHGKAESHLAEKRVIQAIMEMHTQGLSLRQIASCLDHIGVPTKNQGKKWHPEMVKRILSQTKPESSRLQTDSELHRQSVGNLN